MPAAMLSLEHCPPPDARSRATIGESPASAVRCSQLLAVAESPDGVWWLTEHVLSKCGTAAGPRRRSRTIECFHVLEGSMVITIGAHRLLARAGSYTAIPPGVTHAVANEKTAPLRYIQMSAPVGHERHFRERIALVRRVAKSERTSQRDFVTRLEAHRSSN